ncbi:hypothetical protein ACPV5T_20470, partial [Vibrio astriarenae]
LQDLLSDAQVQTNAVHTQFLDERLAELVTASDGAHPALHASADVAADRETESGESPLDALPDDAELLTAPMDGALIQINAQPGETVA